MADLTEEFVNNLDYNEVKGKKIFQKFLAQKQNEQPSSQDEQDEKENNNEQQMKSSKRKQKYNEVEEVDQEELSEQHRSRNSSRSQQRTKEKSHKNKQISSRKASDNSNSISQNNDEVEQEEIIEESESSKSQMHDSRRKQNANSFKSPQQQRRNYHQDENEEPSNNKRRKYEDNSESLERQNNDSKGKYSSKSTERNQLRNSQKGRNKNQRDEDQNSPYEIKERSSNRRNQHQGKEEERYLKRKLRRGSQTTDNRERYNESVEQKNSDKDRKIKELEGRCVDLDDQISRMNAYIENLKQIHFQDGSNQKAQLIELENSIQSLQEKVNSKQKSTHYSYSKIQLYKIQRREDSLEQDNEKLNAKITHEQSLRTKSEEDLLLIRIQLEETKDSVEESKRVVIRKDEEINYLKQQIDSLRLKHSSSLASLETNVNKLRKEKDQLSLEVDMNSYQNKQISELQDKHSFIQSENKRLYNELDNLKKQIIKQSYDTESLKNEMYASKNRIIEMAQKESQLQAKLDGSYSEIKQLKTLLQRAENSMLNQETNGNENRNLFNIQNSQKQQSRRSVNELDFYSVKEQNDLKDQVAQYGSQKHNRESKYFYNLSENSPVNKERKREKVEMNIDTRKISVENRIISQQLKDKNTLTSSDFLSWDMPEYHQAKNKVKSKSNVEEQKIGSFITPKKNAQMEEIYKNYIKEKGRESTQQPESQRKNAKASNPPQNNNRQNQEKNTRQDSPQKSEEIKEIEQNLMLLNVEKDKMKGELHKLEEVKLKSTQNIRLKNDISQKLAQIENNISSLKSKLREAKALY